MNSERNSLILGLAVLAAWGFVVGEIERRHGEAEAPVGRPAERLLSGLGAARAFVADWAWLKANSSWERREADELRGWLTLAIAAEPEDRYFRVNAARMLAFDLPAWLSEAEPLAPGVVQRRWRRAGAEEAIARLLACAQEDAELLIEAANIAWRAGEDRVMATELYGRAASLPLAPWHAGRIYARLLEESGRPREALAWLLTWERERAAEMPAYDRQLLAQRIAMLERELAGEDF